MIKDAEPAARIVDAFHAALARGDATGAAALLDENAAIFEEGDAELSKNAYVAGHLPADISYLREVHESVIGRFGGVSNGVAWIATRGRAKGHFRDRDIDRETTETMILRRTRAGWRILHVHWSSHAVKKPDS